MDNYIPHETIEIKRISMTAWGWAIYVIGIKWT